VTADLFGTHDRSRIAAAIAVRFAVFVDEQGIPPSEELDDHDEERDALTVHALVRGDAGEVLGTGRIVPIDVNTVRIGRMAVMRAGRGRGAGAYLLNALMADARRRGYRRAVLSAQEHAIGFYARAGFAVNGAAELDCGIVHLPMERAL
jgi:predicted GNAT family N-acyltransferase